MSGDRNSLDSQVNPVRGSEYTVRSGVRHRSLGGKRRLTFFGLASIWGFIVGVVGLLAAMRAEGQPVQPPAGVILRLVPALLLAAAGGLVMAAAYKETKRRSSR